MTTAVDAIPPCPACGANRPASRTPVPDREYGVAHLATYVACGECGSLFQSPMPALAELASFYPPTYHAQTGRGALNRVRQALRLRRLAPLLSGDGALLDFGCGNGAFLRYAAARLPGRQMLGYEIADQPRVETAAGGAVTLVHGSLDDLLPRLPQCALVTLNHVIEHLPDPLETATALVARLRPGGAFEGQTPAAGSLEQRVFRTCWSGYHAPRHTVVFSRRGLETLLTRAGLERPTTAGAFNPAALAVSLAATARRRTRRPIQRRGLAWLTYVALGAALAPIDLAGGAPGIQNFLAFKPRS
ncbi:MAG: class I SAM-dependent methyltransferase [Phycisphaerae bacterium]